MTNKNDRLVVGLFPNSAGAKAAAKDIKEWDVWDHDVRLGAMAVLTIDPNSGKLHTDELGQRSTKSGFGWGLGIGAVAAVLSGGLTLIPGLVLGGAAGAGLGSLNHKSVGMTDDQHDALIAALKGGGAALAIMCDDFEENAVIAKLEEAGGNVDHYAMEGDTANAIAAAAAAQAAAVVAIDEAVDEVDEVEVVEVARVVEVDMPDVDEEEVAAVSKLVAATGMNSADAVKLHEWGVDRASTLLAMASTPDGRKALAEESGVDEAVILYEAKKLDLMRVKGVGYKYSALLLASGVDTVPELATRNAANLAKKCAEVNAEEDIVVEAPSEAMVSDWVGQAKDLPRMLYY